MAVKARPSRVQHFPELSREQLVQAYRNMLLGRFLDQKIMVLLRQGKGYFHIGVSGHEAAQVAAALNFRPGHDWFYPYYRDMSFCLQLGLTPEEVLMGFLARAADPSSGGRQMPSHWGHTGLRIVSQSSPTGTQFLQALGCAMGCQREGKDEIVYVSAGEGTTSQGDFHEALNWASRVRAPVLFFIEDNHYAISVPIEEQTSGGSVYNISCGYENLRRFQVDGTDFLKTYEAVRKAVRRIRRGEGPCLVVAKVVRLLPHSSSDDHTKYRRPEELERDRQNDPIPKMEKMLRDEGILSEKEIQALRHAVQQEVDEAAEKTEKLPPPRPETATLYVYSPSECVRKPEEKRKAPRFGDPVVMVDAINHALDEEMARNEKMLIFGQDVADDKGGVFTVTKGLTRKYGRDRVFNAPLAESSIIGVAVGLATRGFRPVAEIQFGDYIWTGMMQLRNELATLRYRSNNAYQCPAVIRVPVGGYIHGGLCHSQNIEGFFAHLPGIRIAYPSNAADAKGLLKTAIRCDDPVLFLEHKGLYRQPFAKRPEPDADFLLPFGKAAVCREGSDLTIVTYGALVQKCLEAARILERDGVSLEIIDIRTINPLDLETILESLAKTSKIVVAHEDTFTAGFGAEIAALIADHGFEYLDGPIRRVAAKDSPIPYAPELENEVLPQVEDILHAVRDLLDY
jgi:2-oxoisovalerate dehydrogenase E1 component